MILTFNARAVALGYYCGIGPAGVLYRPFECSLRITIRYVVPIALVLPAHNRDRSDMIQSCDGVSDTGWFARIPEKLRESPELHEP